MVLRYHNGSGPREEIEKKDFTDSGKGETAVHERRFSGAPLGLIEMYDKEGKLILLAPPPPLP